MAPACECDYCADSKRAKHIRPYECCVCAADVRIVVRHHAQCPGISLHNNECWARRDLRPSMAQVIILKLRPVSTYGSQVIILTLLYSWAGLGIAIVNDFKSVDGDREMGLQSLPVAFGVEKAKWLCVASIDVTQLGIAAWLFLIGEQTYAAVLTAFVLPQIFAQVKYFLPDPVENDVK